METPYLRCLLTLHGSYVNAWELARLIDPAPNMRQLTEMTRQFSQLPAPMQQQQCAQLLRDHPAEFRRAVEAIFARDQLNRVELRCCFYLPEYWDRLAYKIPSMGRYLGTGWGVEFEEAGEAFLTRLPPPLFHLILDELSDGWWYEGRWTPALQQAVWRTQHREVQLQLAMLAGDRAKVAGLLGAEQKRQGYAAVWEFLQGKPESAYLAWQKLIARRRPDLSVFPAWVAPWARLTALAQGDLALFHDRRLEGHPGIDHALDQVRPAMADDPDTQLGHGLEHCFL